MILRSAEQEILLGLCEAPAVTPSGARQDGRTVLAQSIADKMPVK